MWVINTTTIRLEQVDGRRPRPYAILSHCWGSAPSEVTLRDLQNLEYDGDARSLQRRKPGGYAKVIGCCRIARTRGLDWVWIDSCCMDRSDPNEVATAIRSMYRWYRDAEECYAYLADRRRLFFDDAAPGKDSNSSDGRGRRAHATPSRLFSRGWTLQELIAPRVVRFYAFDWAYLGSKHDHAAGLERLTNIPRAILRGGGGVQGQDLLRRTSVAQKMSWASRRNTTVPEDVAYCLLGLFDVALVPLYGEGGVMAFRRLQLEILRGTNDQTIFAWQLPADNPPIETIQGDWWGPLAPHPVFFSEAAKLSVPPILQPGFEQDRQMEIRNDCLSMSLDLARYPNDLSKSLFIARLHVRNNLRDHGANRVAIILQRLSANPECHVYARIEPSMLLHISDRNLIVEHLPMDYPDAKKAGHRAETLRVDIRLRNPRPERLRMYFRPVSLPPSLAGFVFEPERDLMVSGHSPGLTVHVTERWPPRLWTVEPVRPVRPQRSPPAPDHFGGVRDVSLIQSASTSTVGGALSPILSDADEDPHGRPLRYCIHLEDVERFDYQTYERLLRADEPLVLGALGLELVGRNISSGHNRHHDDDHGVSFHLLVGMKPPPPNPFRTKKAFLVPFVLWREPDGHLPRMAPNWLNGHADVTGAGEAWAEYAETYPRRFTRLLGQLEGERGPAVRRERLEMLLAAETRGRPGRRGASKEATLEARLFVPAPMGVGGQMLGAVVHRIVKLNLTIETVEGPSEARPCKSLLCYLPWGQAAERRTVSPPELDPRRPRHRPPKTPRLLQCLLYLAG